MGETLEFHELGDNLLKENISCNCLLRKEDFLGELFSVDEVGQLLRGYNCNIIYLFFGILVSET